MKCRAVFKLLRRTFRITVLNEFKSDDVMFMIRKLKESYFTSLHANFKRNMQEQKYTEVDCKIEIMSGVTLPGQT